MAASFFVFLGTTNAQSVNSGPKPYKILTSGKQITIKSQKNISHIMLWTTGGNRVVEQKEINNPTVSFTVPVNQKGFYLMVGLTDGRIYTEKLGVN
jgi:hypothetical protein